MAFNSMVAKPETNVATPRRLIFQPPDLKDRIYLVAGIPPRLDSPRRLSEQTLNGYQ